MHSKPVSNDLSILGYRKHNRRVEDIKRKLTRTNNHSDTPFLIVLPNHRLKSVSHARTLNLKDPSNDTPPPLSTPLNILSVVGRNDVLARLSVIHDGLVVREKSIEDPVEDAGGDEGVYIPDTETAQVDIILAWL